MIPDPDIFTKCNSLLRRGSYYSTTGKEKLGHCEQEEARKQRAKCDNTCTVWCTWAACEWNGSSAYLVVNKNCHHVINFVFTERTSRAWNALIFNPFNGCLGSIVEWLKFCFTLFRIQWKSCHIGLRSCPMALVLLSVLVWNLAKDTVRYRRRNFHLKVCSVSIQGLWNNIVSFSPCSILGAKVFLGLGQYPSHKCLLLWWNHCLKQNRSLYYS